MVIAKIAIDPAVAEYARGRYGANERGVVKFPPSSDLYVMIYDFMERRPINRPLDSGNFAFFLPDRREANRAGGKAPEYFNYISEDAAARIEERLRRLMWADFHDYMDRGKHCHGKQYKDLVWQFMEQYGIQSLTEEALLKNYQRWRYKIGRTVKKEKKTRKNT